jgi:hypothetical protein
MSFALLPPLALLAAAAAPAPAPADERPAIATIGSENMFGGEALFTGRLAVRDGCLVADFGSGVATPVFDPGVILSPDGKTLHDPAQGSELPLGRRFSAGSAWMRDGGTGWTVAEIEAFYGTRIPPGCPTHNVIRLHDFEPPRKELR